MVNSHRKYTGKRSAAVTVVTLLTALLLPLAFTTSLGAQKKEIEEIKKFIKKKRVNAGYVIGGLNLLELNSLNVDLEKRNLPHVPPLYMSYGVGGHFVFNKVVLGVELVRTQKRQTLSNMEFNLAASSKFYLLNLGHLIYRKKGIMLYPYLGAGLGRFKMEVIENNIDSFGRILDVHNRREATISHLLINLGFAGDCFFKYNKKKKGRNNFMIGLRVGFNITPAKSRWHVEQIPVDDGPQTGLSGPYFRIVIGVGGWAERLIRKAMR